MSHGKFSESALQGLKPREKDYVLSDPSTPYLYVRVHPSGSKMLFCQFREGKRIVKKNIGRVGGISLADAKEMAGKLKLGLGAPDLEKVEVASLTVLELTEKFIEGHLPHLKPRTREDYQKHLVWLNERVGHLPVEEIDKPYARRLKSDYPGKVAGNRFLATCRKCWRWAFKAGHIEINNPWDAVQKSPEKPRQTMADQEQLLAILDSIRAENPRVKAYHLTILLTCCRRGEADAMRFRDIKDGIWEKPNTKNKKGHRVYLPEEVRSVIGELPQGKPEDKVFSNFMGHGKAWERILIRAGLPYPSVRVHDLRRSVATMLLTTGRATVQEISLMLGHSDVGVTMRIYARYLGDNRDAVRAVSSLLSRPISPALES